MKHDTYFELEANWDLAKSLAGPIAPLRLLERLFGVRMEPHVTSKQMEQMKLQQLVQRCYEKLKNISTFFPDVLPEGVEIVRLNASTEHFISFPEIYQLIDEHDKVIDRFEKLFFLALSRNLEQQEIEEFDCLSEHLRACDLLFPSLAFTYQYVDSNRELFVDEGYAHLQDYARIRYDLCPWKASEFYQDKDKVRQYLLEHPHAKKSIFDFLTLVENYSCTYTLSNFTPMPESDDGLFLDDDTEDIPGIGHIYLPKEEDELGENRFLVDGVRQLFQSSALGGIDVELPSKRTALSFDIRRVQKRFEKGWVRE